MTIVTRQQWGAAPPESVTKRQPSALAGVVVHWFASPRAKPNHSECDDLLRSVQRSHQGGEFNDIAYNHAVCPHGTLYELRGFGVQAGANGTSASNRDYAAIVAMMGTGDKPTPAVYEGLKDLIRAWRVKGAGHQVRTHGSITGSACPGPEITAWVKAGKYEGNTPSQWKKGDPIWENLPGQKPKPPWFWKALKEMDRRRTL